MSLFDYTLLALLGIAAGVINMLAGGGSNLTLPALMIMGLPADIANATNRLGIFLQNLVGVRQFHRGGRLDLSDMPLMLVPTLIGAFIGSLLAAFAPVWFLKPTLLLTMLTMAAIMLIRPAVVMADVNMPARKMKETPSAWLWLFFAGMYGGFVQAGVGFVLITACAGALRYDLVRANALKLFITLIFTTLALVVFIWQGQVLWLAGIALGLGNMLGAVIGVRIAISVKPKTLKQILFLMTVVAVIVALFSGEKPHHPISNQSANIVQTINI